MLVIAQARLRERTLVVPDGRHCLAFGFADS